MTVSVATATYCRGGEMVDAGDLKSAAARQEANNHGTGPVALSRTVSESDAPCVDLAAERAASKDRQARAALVTPEHERIRRIRVPVDAVPELAEP